MRYRIDGDREYVTVRQQDQSCLTVLEEVFRKWLALHLLERGKRDDGRYEIALTVKLDPREYDDNKQSGEGFRPAESLLSFCAALQCAIDCTPQLRQEVCVLTDDQRERVKKILAEEFG